MKSLYFKEKIKTEFCAALLIYRSPLTVKPVELSLLSCLAKPLLTAINKISAKCWGHSLSPGRE